MKNIARGKSAVQSSDFSSYRIATRAIDGYLAEWCTSTEYGDWTPYWAVDLGKKAVVLNVTILGHYDFESEKVYSFEIKVGDSTTNGYVGNAICVSGVPMPYHYMKNFTCPESEGRHVSLHVTGDYLQLCEVQVYGIFL